MFCATDIDERVYSKSAFVEVEDESGQWDTFKYVDNSNKVERRKQTNQQKKDHFNSILWKISCIYLFTFTMHFTYLHLQHL